MAGAGVTSRTVMLGAVLFAGGVLLCFLSPTLPLRLIGALLFGAGSVMFFAAVQWRHRLVAFAEFLGVRSYTIYIVHFPFLALASAYVIHTRGGRPLHGWLAVSGAIACVAFGCVCFELCERHFLHSRYRDESAAP
jgi:peptidoglycan/LPS O-acetylase OafA/YrhL